MIGAVFSLPPVRKPLESIIRLPCSIDAWGRRVIARPDTNWVPKSFKGAKPEGAPNAYDARSVMKYIGSQIGVEQGKNP